MAEALLPAPYRPRKYWYLKLPTRLFIKGSDSRQQPHIKQCTKVKYIRNGWKKILQLPNLHVYQKNVNCGKLT